MAAKKQKTLLATLLRVTFRNFYSTVLAVLVLACALLVASVRLETARQAIYSADMAAFAYRPAILRGMVREAELQLRTALGLRESESVVIRRPDFSAIYPLRDSDVTPRCTKIGQVCWSGLFGGISVLVPIYFDEPERQSLYGYLELTRYVSLSWSFPLLILLAIVLTFAILGYRHYWYLREIVKELTEQLSKWAGQIEIASRDSEVDDTESPYAEMERLQSAVNGFRAKVRRLEEEAKNAARTDLLREIGHDLRTPLAQLSQSIALHLDTVESQGESDPEEVGRIKRALTRMGDLIRQLRALKPGESTLQKGPESICDLSRSLETFSNDFRKSLSVIEKDVEVASSASAGLESDLSAIDFYRILDNLTRNALYVSPNGGKIRITLSRSGDWNVLRVSDEGPGVPEAIRERIFDFDFTTKATRGTGLGLGIVRSLCQSHGGEVSLCADSGTGATFEVRLPIRQVSARSTQVQILGVENGV